MTSFMTRFDQPVPQSPLRSWFYAWDAVHDGTPLDAYLRYRLRVYQAKGRKSFHPLPVHIDVVQGRIVLTPNPAYEPHWDRLTDDSAGDRGPQFMSAIEQHEIARDADRLKEEDDEVTARFRALSGAIEQREMEQVDAISEGTQRGPRTLARLTQRCLQHLPFPWLLLLESLAIALMGLVEVFQLTWPCLDLLGVDTANLTYEYARSPVAVVGGVASAIGATAGVILLWHLLVSRAVAFATEWETAGPLRSGARLVGLVFLCVFLFIGTLFIAHMRHSTAVSASTFQDATPGEHAASHTGTGVFVFMTILIPAGAAYLSHKITQSAYWERRADRQAQQARRDQAEDQLLLPGERWADAIELLQKKRVALEEQQARLDARRQALARRVRDAQEAWRKRLEDERLATQTYVRTLLSALEMDRYYFVRAAFRCQAMHLVPEESACLSQGSTSASVIEGHGASSQDEVIPQWQVVRPLLTDKKQGDDS